jgi:hypothetical protein
MQTPGSTGFLANRNAPPPEHYDDSLLGEAVFEPSERHKDARAYLESEIDDSRKRRERRIPKFDHTPNARPDVRYRVLEQKPPGAG